MERDRVILRWLPALLWMGLIFVLSARPDLPHAPEPWLDLLLKKAGHLVLYGMLARLYLYALEGPSGSPRSRWLALALVLVYGLWNEFYQSLVPGRTPSFWDVVIDGAGGGLALFWGRERR